jgi:hypothetical protein
MSGKPSRKMILCISVTSILVLIAGILWWDVIKQLYPSQTVIDDKVERLKRAKRELRKETEEGKSTEKWLDCCRTVVSSKFINEKGTASLRKRLEDVAKQCELTITAIGTPRESRLRCGSSWQLNLTANGSLKNMMNFFKTLSDNENKILWRRFSLKPMSSRSADELRLTATFCAFSMDAKNRQLLAGRKERLK